MESVCFPLAGDFDHGKIMRPVIGTKARLDFCGDFLEFNRMSSGQNKDQRVVLLGGGV